MIGARAGFALLAVVNLRSSRLGGQPCCAAPVGATPTVRPGAHFIRARVRVDEFPHSRRRPPSQRGVVGVGASVTSAYRYRYIFCFVTGALCSGDG